MTTTTEFRTTLTERANSRSWRTSTRRSSDRPDGHSIVYVDVRGEDVLEQIANRRARPYNALRPIVAASLTEAGVPFERLRWSQHAGCTCPCSPGFTIEGGPRGRDFWLTIEA